MGGLGPGPLGKSHEGWVLGRCTTWALHHTTRPLPRREWRCWAELCDWGSSTTVLQICSGCALLPPGPGFVPGTEQPFTPCRGRCPQRTRAPPSGTVKVPAMSWCEPPASPNPNHSSPALADIGRSLVMQWLPPCPPDREVCHPPLKSCHP